MQAKVRHNDRNETESYKDKGLASFFTNGLITKTRRVRIITGLVFLLAVFGCQTDGVQRPDHLVFRYNESGNISSLDPAFARNPQNIWPTNQLFNGLVQLDDSLNIRPDIARDWSYNDSTLTYRFFLRKGVYFHKHPVFGTDQTRQVTADDFVYSFDRLEDPNLAAPGSWVMQQVDRYWAENDSTLAIRLKQAFPPFLGILSMRYCSVVPHEAITHFGEEFRKNPIGTGPFAFKLWIENTKLVLRKNPIYYKQDQNGLQLPYLEAIAISFLPDKQSEFLEFSQGNLDFISGIDQSYKDALLTPQGQLHPDYNQRVYLLKSPFLNTEYVGFSLQEDRLEIQSELIRKAINFGIDRKKMITYLRNGIGLPADKGFIPKGLKGSGEHVIYPYDVAEARRLVDSFKLLHPKISPKLTLSTNAQYLDLCEYMQTQLDQIGLEMAIDVLPPSTLRQLKNTGGLELFRASWVADYPDAENYLSLFISQNFTPNGPNYTHFQSREIDSLYRQSMRVQKDSLRWELYRIMDQKIMQQAPIIPLYYDMAVRFVSKKVIDLGINPQNFLFLERTRKR